MSRVILSLVALSLLSVPFAIASGEKSVGVADIDGVTEKAIRFLRITQRDDGSWTKSDMTGVTGLVTTALLRSGVSAEDPMIATALKHLLASQQPSGGFHSKDSLQKNYETCITIFALSEANEDGKYDAAIKKAEGFLRELQWDQGEGIESSDPAFGGGGYGSHQRPDLSNTQYLIEALRKAGVSDDDPAMEKVRVFVSRTQNLETGANDTKFSGLINDGGFYYTPAAGGDSKAGTTENGGLRSYGSMTYAGLKSLIYAGVKEDDERVVSAKAWLQNHYTLQENPGMGQQGLFYYFHTFAKTMSLVAPDGTFSDADGKSHDWKAELRTRLSELQQRNGSWQNPADRWYEGDPNLVTAYSLMGLSYCR